MLWLNGHLLPPAQARIDPADRGFLLGDGLFETMRAVGGRVPLLARHLSRLETGCQLLGLPPPRADVIEGAIAGILTAFDRPDAAVRLTLTRGPGPRGLAPSLDPTPTTLIAAFALPPPAQPVRAIVAGSTRRNERSPLSRAKVLGYLDSILALREAHDRGADDALLLNTRDRLACATTANLWVVRGGRLLTPPPDEGALPGITRALLLEIAPSLGLERAEALLGPSDLAAAEEVFTTSSLRLVTPLASIDGRPVPGGAPGPLTKRVALALREAAALEAPGRKGY